MEQYAVFLESSDGTGPVAEAQLYEDRDDVCRIDLTFDNQSLTGTASDYFDAFCDVREQLEPLGFLPHCYGADLQTFPSGMSRSMGAGIKAYRLKSGVPARMGDLVHIFDTGKNVKPSTVQDQRAFFNEWLASLSG